jgi:hypothetical protein
MPGTSLSEPHTAPSHTALPRPLPRATALTEFMSSAAMPGTSGTIPSLDRRFTEWAPMGPSWPQEDTTTCVCVCVLGAEAWGGRRSDGVRVSSRGFDAAQETHHVSVDVVDVDGPTSPHTDTATTVASTNPRTDRPPDHPSCPLLTCASRTDRTPPPSPPH